MRANVDQCLRGKTVLVTRSRSQASELAARIEQLGGNVLQFPVIKQVPPADPGPLQRAIESIDTYDWLLFTSVNGIRFFQQALQEGGVRFPNIPAKIGVVGPRTAEALEQTGRTADIVAEDFKAEGLLAALQKNVQPGDKILFPRADIARPLLAEKLREMGCEVTDVDAYDTVLTDEGIDEVVRAFRQKQIDVITFTSSSTVKNFCDILRKYPYRDWLDGVRIACIGPVTADTAVKLGLPVDAVADVYTIEGLVEAVCKLYL